MRNFETPEKHKSTSAVILPKKKQSSFFAPETTQTKSARGAAEVKKESTSANYFKGSIKGYLTEHINLYHTLNNYGNTQQTYKLRIKNQGECLLSLETQYQNETTGLQRAWIALFAQRNQTEVVINGLPPHSSLHIRLFGEIDYTDKDATWCEGTVEAERIK